ncbi:bifunctional diaminohydroxyphosphoribosylaminopyrimidine deaminase/5-amino-6-(5-phosphoribosylamino)uracil reductase RibD [Arthrobacter sp. E918]|uniref:Riboflavin biosynthesis protein RibD n=2 Tax=Arthrobacter mobilis TaxID=2724944 RepID=A0A7X6K5Q8_9MICC|nr:bifunctional diaminohydroxyphosphoribosylaminopyrimidine deaminase/5-amino-6-(5-phosphoribosylamino)uracil reductase RibD [Arthrobacter mobilis]
MQAALDAAGQGPRGANPLVGAAILAPDGTVLSVGYHRGAGTAHAEIDALAVLREKSGGSLPNLSACTMVVTLEPCSHHGRTGPCAAAIAEAGVGAIVYAAADPTAEAAGGARYLLDAGVAVRAGLLSGPALELNQRWFRAKAEDRPFTTLHIAQTLDGLIAAADGTSQWITGAAARQDSHGIRARVDAIVAGTGTVLADDPRLTARDADGRELERQPLRVVVGRREVPASAAVRGRDGKFLQLAGHDPAAVLGELAARGAGHVMIEGGATVAGAFLAADLVDELVLYLAPLMLGTGIRSTGDLGISTLADASRWRWDPVAPARTLGADLRLTLEPLPLARHNERP